MRSSLGGVLALGCVAGAALAAPAAAQDPAAAVRTELEAYYADFSDRDWDAFASHFWPGAVIATTWQPPDEPDVRVVVQTVPEFVARAPAGPGSREIFEEWMIGADVRVEGGLAQAWVRYGARFGDPGDLLEWQGTDAFTLLMLEGRWRIASLAFAADAADTTPQDSDPTPSPAEDDMVNRLTPILHVEAIEPMLPFWEDRLGFQRDAEVMEGDRLGFVMLSRGDAQLMVQTQASVEADVSTVAEMPVGGAILYIQVDDLDEILPALEGLEVLVPRRTTFYGAEEIFVREPGGNVVGFAAFGEEPSG